MRTQLVWALPLLVGVLGCKPKPSETPDGPTGADAHVGHGSRPWAEASPSVQPREVCEHLVRMVAAEAGMPEIDIDAAMMAECEAELAIEANVRGTDNWNAVAQCVLAARTEADLDACDRAYPIPGGGGPGPGPGPSGPSGSGGPQVGERELQVCEHMIETLMLEAAAESGEVPPVTREEIEGLIFECAMGFVVEQQPQLAPVDYERLLDCIDAADSSAQMQRCD